MKINFDYVFVDMDDKEILEEKGQAINVQRLLKQAALADANPDGSPLKPDEKYERYELYMKLRSADATTEFSASEVALLDKAVRVYPTLIAGQLLRLLKI